MLDSGSYVTNHLDNRGYWCIWLIQSNIVKSLSVVCKQCGSNRRVSELFFQLVIRRMWVQCLQRRSRTVCKPKHNNLVPRSCRRSFPHFRKCRATVPPVTKIRLLPLGDTASKLLALSQNLSYCVKTFPTESKFFSLSQNFSH